MNKVLLAVVGGSIGLTVLISTVFGFAGSSIIGSFWGWFWITLIVQFVLFGIVNSVLQQKQILQIQQQEIEALDKLSKFSVKMNCAYCQQPNVTPIQLNQRNTFKCESCNQVNSVVMQFMATALTTPIESVKIPTENTNSIEFKVS